MRGGAALAVTFELPFALVPKCTVALEMPQNLWKLSFPSRGSLWCGHHIRSCLFPFNPKTSEINEEIQDSIDKSDLFS